MHFEVKMFKKKVKISHANFLLRKYEEKLRNIFRPFVKNALI